MHTAAMETERCETAFYTPRNMYEAIQTTEQEEEGGGSKHEDHAAFFLETTTTKQDEMDGEENQNNDDENGMTKMSPVETSRPAPLFQLSPPEKVL